MVAQGQPGFSRPDVEPPIVDREQITGLLSAAGAEGTREILFAFWKSTDALLQTLKAQLAAGRFDDAARTAHALKGSALNVGAVRISLAARGIEDACKVVDVDAAKEKIGDAEIGRQDTVKAFEALIAAAG